jgi:hypothetical protein
MPELVAVSIVEYHGHTFVMYRYEGDSKWRRFRLTD